MSSKELFSFSKLSSFHSCEYGYHISYHQHKKGDNNCYGILGGVIHDELEKLVKGETTIEEAKEQWSNEFDLCEFMGYDFPTEKSKSNYKEDILHFLDTFKPLELKEPHTEEYFEMEVDGVQMRGYIDLFDVDHEAKTVKCIDYKTSSKFTKKDLASEKVFQLILYCMYLEEQYPEYTILNPEFLMIKYVKQIDGRHKVVERKDLDPLFCDNFEAWHLEVQYNDEMKNKLKIYVKETVAKINNKCDDYAVEYNEAKEQAELFGEDFSEQNKDELIAKVWKPNVNPFYCANLCNHRKTCKFNKENV